MISSRVMNSSYRQVRATVNAFPDGDYSEEMREEESKLKELIESQFGKRIFAGLNEESYKDVRYQMRSYFFSKELHNQFVDMQIDIQFPTRKPGTYDFFEWFFSIFLYSLDLDPLPGGVNAILVEKDDVENVRVPELEFSDYKSADQNAKLIIDGYVGNRGGFDGAIGYAASNPVILPKDLEEVNDTTSKYVKNMESIFREKFGITFIGEVWEKDRLPEDIEIFEDEV